MDGEVNPCYFLMRELEQCVHDHLYHSRDCGRQREDFYECHNRGKQVSPCPLRPS